MAQHRPSPRAAVGWKLLEYIGLVVFTVIVPRMMGPESFGSLMAVMALVGLWTASTALGAYTTFGRFVPEFVERGNVEAVARLYTQLLAVRVAMAIPLGIGLMLAIRVLLPELRPSTAVFGACAFAASSIGLTGYQLLFGLNRLGRSLVRNGLARLVLAVGILTIGDGATPENAIVLLFGIECGFALLVLIWVAPYFRGSALRSPIREVREALTFGAVFYGAFLLLLAIWRGGEVAVTALAESRSEVAFYSIAGAAAMALSSLLGQVNALLLPSLTSLYLRGDQERFEEWMAVSMRYVTLAAVVFTIAIFAASDWALAIMLGSEFERVAPNLKLLAVGLIPMGLVQAATSLAVVQKRSRQVVLMSLEGFAAFVVAAILLVPPFGSIGASIAVSLAFVIAGLRAWSRMGLGDILAKAHLWRVAGPGCVLAFFLIPGIPRLVAGLLAMAVYLGAVILLGVLRPGELRTAMRRL